MWWGSRGFRPAVLAVVVSVLGTFVATAASPAGAVAGAATKCSGDPIVFGVIAPLTVGPGTTQEALPDGPGPVVAAAKAVTKSCAAGVPVKVTVCDSKSDPNAAAGCARDGVDEGWVGWFNADTLTAAQSFPILAAAGIPELGGLGLGPEVASKLWFPIGGAIAAVLTAATLATSATGKEPAKLAVVTLDNPQVKFLLDLLEGQLKALDGQLVTTIAVPTSATDMAQYAAQVLDSGANAVMPVLAQEQATGLYQQLIQQGAKFVDLPVLMVNGSSPSADKTLHDQFGEDVKGIWVAHSTAIIDPKNPGVRQYFKELKAAKQPKTGLWVQGDPAFAQWGLLHIAAELLADAPTKDAAALVDALNTAGPISKPGLPTVDYSTNPFADNPTLAMLRIFTNEFIASRLQADASEQIVSDGFVTVGEPFKPKKLK
jgi:ABC-type branched-subunit amino acid transport system substrate-binding protein